MSTPVELILREAGLPDDAVADLGPLLTALRDLEPEHAPEPGLELARLLAAPVTPARIGAGRRSMVVAATLLGTSVTATGVAAAANELPEPAQRLVSQLSERYLPFEFPPPEPVPEPQSEPATEPLPPAVEGPSGEGPAPAASAETGTLPVGRPTGTPTAAPSARPSATPSSGAGTPTPTSSPAPEPTGSPAGEVAGPPEGAAPAPGLPEETAAEGTPTADPSAAPSDAAARDDGRPEEAQQPQTPAPTPEATVDPAALAPPPPAG